VAALVSLASWPTHAFFSGPDKATDSCAVCWLLDVALCRPTYAPLAELWWALPSQSREPERAIQA